MKSARTAAWGIACLLLLGGCPGQLEFPVRVLDSGAGGRGGGSGGAPQVPQRVDAGVRAVDAARRGPDAARRGPDAGVRRPDAGRAPDAAVQAVVCTTAEQAIARVLRPKCGMCHDATVAMLSGGLDVIAPGVRDRLRLSSGVCMGRAFVVSAPAVGGYFFDKLGTPPCGARMPPIGPPLEAGEIECLKSWIRANP